jgi:hypothetical protein
MRFSLHFQLAALMLATATALPAESAVPDTLTPDMFKTPDPGSNDMAFAAFEHAKKIGVDPTGPMPEDYDSKDNGTILFSEGSKVAAWAAAQPAVPEAIRARNSGIDIVYVIYPIFSLYL